MSTLYLRKSAESANYAHWLARMTMREIQQFTCFVEIPGGEHEQKAFLSGCGSLTRRKKQQRQRPKGFEYFGSVLMRRRTPTTHP
ncbi:MAG: hypothetical protein WBO24_01465 [Nitrospirales bacterium]